MNSLLTFVHAHNLHITARIEGMSNTYRSGSKLKREEEEEL
jgi:hypothetical protein